MSECLLPLVSVIIPVYNDGKRLRLCLQALKQQTYAQDRYEVIVIDNGSEATEKIKDIVHSEGAIALYEEIPGSYVARNKGLTVAKGEAIAFTDADCIPAPDWIAKGVAHLQRVPNCGFVGGEIEIFWRDRDRPSTVELYESILAFRQQDCIEKHHYSVTANLFTWKQVIERVGVFNSRLKSNGDIEWGNRVYAQGYRQIYAKDVLVKHPALYSFQQLRKKVIRYAGGDYDRRNQPEHNWLVSNWLLTKAIAFNLMPPVFFAINNYDDPKLKTRSDKLKVILTMTLVRYITVLELLRLKLGGVSARQ
ncbi:MAG: glycosyltransferase family 2 protein [Pleurocapsa sp. MO_226.B13]|nr:glycosyltransferase family 2 protein [Pleurocapsa sp. MO_226.B13]